jgi:antitoxin YefM
MVRPASPRPLACPGHGVVTLVVTSEVMSLAAVTAQLSEVVDRVLRTHERVTITRHGRQEAVNIAPADLDAFEDTLELLSDPEAVREIAEARDAADRGEGSDADALRPHLGRLVESIAPKSTDAPSHARSRNAGSTKMPRARAVCATMS